MLHVLPQYTAQGLRKELVGAVRGWSSNTMVNPHQFYVAVRRREQKLQNLRERYSYTNIQDSATLQRKRRLFWLRQNSL